MARITDIAVALVGGAYVLFAPGLVLSFVFFRRDAIDWLERVALSFALSVAVVPLVVFYLNMIGIKLTRLSVVLEVAAIMVVSGGVVWWRVRRVQPRKPPAAKPAPVMGPEPSVPPTKPAPRRRSMDAVGRRNHE
ncbi:MAG: hypothetical protein JWN01_602 [Patescibacteria group bacterium]|nr:hypothetical protein [Patescibacteria group bacterium]